MVSLKKYLNGGINPNEKNNHIIILRFTTMFND